MTIDDIPDAVLIPMAQNCGASTSKKNAIGEPVLQFTCEELREFFGAVSEMIANMTDCPDCHGSGEGTAMEGRGPDTYEVTIICPRCNGTGTAAQATTCRDPGAEGQT